MRIFTYFFVTPKIPVVVSAQRTTQLTLEEWAEVK